MSGTPSSSDSFRTPPTSDGSNFNVSFNGNKSGQGFAIYIVPSGPPSDGQSAAPKSKSESPPIRSLEGRPTQVGQENHIRIQETFGNFSPSSLPNQGQPQPPLDNVHNGNIMRVNPREESSLKRGASNQLYEKASMINHWKDGRVGKSEKDEVYNWSRTATTKLLDLYISDRYFDRFRDRFTKKKVLWNEIAEYLNREGYTMGLPLSGEQCANKFRNLKKVYIKCKNQNLHSAESARRFEYFTQLDTIFSQLSPTHDMQAVEYQRDNRIHGGVDMGQRVPLDQYGGSYQDHCGSPQHDYDYTRSSHSDYVDLSHSPIDTKPVLVDSEDVVREKDDIVIPRYENEASKDGQSQSAPVPISSDSSSTCVTTATPYPLLSPIAITKRKTSQSEPDIESSAKVVCITDSDDERRGRATPALPDHTDSVHPVVSQTVDSKRKSSDTNSPQAMIELFQKHIEERNKAFSNFVNAMTEMHQQETKLLSTMASMMQRALDKN